MAAPAAARCLRAALRQAAIDTGVPGIFTWAGYHDTFLPLLPTVTKDIAEDGWVLGRDQNGGVAGTIARGEPAAARRARPVSRRLRRGAGMRMLADIAIKPFRIVQEARTSSSLSAAPDLAAARPAAVASTRRPSSAAPAATDAAQAQAEAEGGEGRPARGRASADDRARSGLTLKQNETRRHPRRGVRHDAGAASRSIRRSGWTSISRRCTTSSPAARATTPAPMEAAISKIGAIYQGFNQVANAPNQGQALLNLAAGGGGGAGRRLRRSCRTPRKDLPKPIAADAADRGAEQQRRGDRSGASKELSDAWKPRCCRCAKRRSTATRSSPTARPTCRSTISPTCSAPAALIDQFFNQNLKPFVDTTQQAVEVAGRRTTAARPVAGSSLTSSSAPRRSAMRCSPAAPQIGIKFQLAPVDARSRRRPDQPRHRRRSR